MYREKSRNTTDRIGKTNRMHNGMLATIIEYRKSTDIDVQFEDGAIRKHCRYQEFKHGYISHPNNTRSAREKERVGQKRIMKNGLEATLITYRSSASVDVQFDDGTIIYNKTYDEFNSGKVGHPEFLHINKKKNRVGEKGIAKNGMKMTIVAYRKSTDIDIEFEDGAIREHCAYKEFNTGNISHPTHTTVGMANERIGEKKYMNCGLEATIIKYTKYHDIDISFSDGTKVCNVDYGRFQEGTIEHPLMKERAKSLQESAVEFYMKELGFVKSTRGNLRDVGLGNMELDFYHSEKKIAIEIDGGIHKHKSQYERDLRKNSKCIEAGITLYRLRDKSLPLLDDGLSTNYILNGEKLIMGLVDCKECLEQILCTHDIKLPCENFIDFKRDFSLIMDYHYTRYINYYRNKRIGEQMLHKPTNQIMTIIDYRDYNHIDVQFEDGKKVFNKNYGAFKLGNIAHPSTTQLIQSDDRIGERRKMHCGSVAKIIAYRDSEDMDVMFEDGTIIEGVTYYNFVTETILNPNISHTQALSDRVGETRKMNCGLWATIIAYKNQYNMDIQFEDGKIRYGVQYEKFQRGSVLHPDKTKEAKAQRRIGETRIMNCGKKATIIAYRTSHDIDVQFEDGVIVYNKKYSRFQKGSVVYPLNL